MPLDEEEFKRWKAKVDQLQAEAMRVEGTLRSLRQRLRDDFGVKTVKEAEGVLAKLEPRSKKLSQEAEDALLDFETSYKDRLNAVEDDD